MAKGKKRKFGNFRYPMAVLDKHSDYLEIKVIEYRAPGFESAGEGKSFRLKASSDTLGKNKEDILGTIILPVPQTITDSNGVTWSENSLNGLAAKGLGIAGAVMSADSMEDAKNKLTKQSKGAVKDFLSDDMTKSAVNAQFASMAVNALGGNTTSGGVLARQTGAILNPNMELLFGGVQLRSFNFDFDFAPRDERESVEIKKIIRAFKIHMNAKRTSQDNDGGSGLFIKSPDVFQLTYKTGNKDHQFLHRFKPMAMLNMAVNYTGAGTYATYDNTSPVQLKMNLTFQELNPIYSEDYEGVDNLEGGTGF